MSPTAPASAGCRAAAGAGPARLAAIVNRPPDCTALVADPDTFERHDRRLRIVRVGGAGDPDGDSVEIEVTGVTQDETVVGRGDHTRPDACLMSAGTWCACAPSAARAATGASTASR